MEPDKEIQRHYFDSICADTSGTSFQKWFEKLMKRLDPQFVPIGHEGRGEGDHGCDGFSIKTGRLYQVYMPATKKENLAKVERDFKRAVEKWGDRIKEWVFVHGKLEIIPTMTKLVIDLAKEKGIKILPWNNDDLWKLVLELSNDDRVDILGIPSHFKDEPMRALEEIRKGIHTLTSSQVTKDDEEESITSIGMKELKGVHDLKDDISRRKLLLRGVSGSDESIILDSLAIAKKMLPDDPDIVSAVDKHIDQWSDQTASDALFNFLDKSEDNRKSDIMLKVASDEKRGRNFRRDYFTLIGKHGRSYHLEEMERLSEREESGPLKTLINKAIDQIKERSPPTNAVRSLSLRFSIGLKNTKRSLSSGNFPLLDIEDIDGLIENPSFQELSIDIQEKLLSLRTGLMDYNRLRKTADVWIRFHPLGEPYPVPDKYVPDIAAKFVFQLDDKSQRLVLEIDSMILSLKI